MSRPSDEDMVGVVKEWKEWPIDCIGFTRRNIRLYASEGCTDSFGERLFSDEPDPRDDTDAALELVGWLSNIERTLPVRFIIDELCGDWLASYWPPNQKNPTVVQIPTSGEPFRNAVVRLAVEVKRSTTETR